MGGWQGRHCFDGRRPSLSLWAAGASFLRAAPGTVFVGGEGVMDFVGGGRHRFFRAALTKMMTMLAPLALGLPKGPLGQGAAGRGRRHRFCVSGWCPHKPNRPPSPSGLRGALEALGGPGKRCRHRFFGWHEAASSPFLRAAQKNDKDVSTTIATLGKIL